MDTRNHQPAGTVPLYVMTRYQAEDGYLCGVLHVAKGWHWCWQSRDPLGEELSGVMRGPFPSETSARLNAFGELMKRKGELLDQRVQTAGHGRRARLQGEIDALTDRMESLSI